MRTFIFLAFILTNLMATVSAADWPCWRGPAGLGVSAERNLPLEWRKDKNIAWKLALPGKGASSPIVVGDRVYLTTQSQDTGLHLLAVDGKSGEVVWDREIARGKLRANNLHNMATPTAVAEGQWIWVLFGTGDLACVDRAGQVSWQRNLVKDYGEYKILHGYGSSPMLHDGKLFIPCMHQGPSYLLAVDAKTGTTIWKKERKLGPKDEAQDSYSSPLFLRADGRTQVVLAGAEGVNAYDPGSGEQIWICDGLKVPHPFGRTIAGLAAGEGVVVTVASGFQNRGYTLALKTGGKGNITDTHKLWTCNKFSSDCPTPVVYEGKLYFIRDDGMASCLDLKTGEAHWQERLFNANVKVSPVAGDGKIYFVSGQGNCTVVKAGPSFEVLARNDLAEGTLSTPALSQGRLFFRTEAHLYCVMN
jgi:outer membrane protein assembly factor BamB